MSVRLDEVPLEQFFDHWWREQERWARGQLAIAELEADAAYRGRLHPDELRRRYPGLYP